MHAFFQSRQKTKKQHLLPKFLRKPLIAMFLILISFLLLYLAQHAAMFADLYSQTVYVFLVNTIGRFFGLFPFSVVEILLYSFVIFWVVYLIVSLVRAVLFKKLSRIGMFISNFLLFGAILFFSYTLCCGINYGRTSFSETTGIETFTYSSEELAQLCLYLTEQVNALAPLVNRDENNVTIISDNYNQTAQAAMYRLGETYSELSGYYPQPKALLFSYLLSVQQLAGVYSPFTIEANYNQDMTDYHIPFTACHELSHLRGFMQEEEANFIAFLACIGSDNAEFQYSGYLIGWVYATNQLSSADRDTYRSIYSQLDTAVKSDLSANNTFWSQYQGKVAEVSNQINDNYLKANGQSAGVMSYNHMVDLMMAYYADSAF